MEQRRISERNNLYEKILHEKSAIEKERRSIALLKHNNTLSREFIKTKIEKSKDRISKCQGNVDMYEKKREEVKKGYYDDEITKTYKQSYQKPIAPPVKKKEPVPIRYFDRTKFTSDRRISEGEIKRAYKYFNSVSDTIPEYLMKKLKQMPNNKGYIWRGVYFYGQKPAEKNRPITMFEKNKGVLKIHEWHENKYQLWKKEGDARKVLVNQHSRKLKN